jgi:hypothetical protein
VIKWQDAIREARLLIGTPYNQLDCINLIKRVIRTAPGGMPGYTTAGTNTLWRSYESSPKYKDLTWRQADIFGARAGMLAFKLYGGDDVGHVGIVTDDGTVIHSSSVRGKVVEDELKAADGWDLLAVHRYIEPKEEGDDADMTYETLFKAKVDTVSGPLNLRELPAKNAMLLEKMPKGEIVEVVEKTNLEWWKVRYKGEIGYAAEEYLSRIIEKEPEIPEQGEAGLTVQIVITDEAGNVFRPVGAFAVDIEMLLDGEPLEEAEGVD